MRIIIKFLIIGVIFSNVSFAQNQNLSSLNWLLGKWKSETVNRLTTETWYSISPTTFQGRGISISQSSGDTLFVEDLWIIEAGREIFYIAKVDENEFPVSFKLAALAQNTVIFSNPEHDYPQRISYSLSDNGELFTTVVGMKDGKEGKLELKFIKSGDTIEADRQ